MNVALKEKKNTLQKQMSNFNVLFHPCSQKQKEKREKV